MKSYNTIHSCVENLSHGPATNPDFLEIEVAPDSADFVLFQGIVNQGIDSQLEAFVLSEFGYRRYYSIGVRAFFHFHKSEIPILIRRLSEISDSMYDCRITRWLDDFRNYSF